MVCKNLITICVFFGSIFKLHRSGIIILIITFIIIIFMHPITHLPIKPHICLPISTIIKTRDKLLNNNIYPIFCPYAWSCLFSVDIQYSLSPSGKIRYYIISWNAIFFRAVERNTKNWLCTRKLSLRAMLYVTYIVIIFIFMKLSSHWTGYVELEYLPSYWNKIPNAVKLYLKTVVIWLNK